MNRFQKKQLSVGVIFSYLIIIIQCLSSVIYTPIILSALGQSEYGVYSLCSSFSGYLTIFNGGLNAAFVRFYVQTKAKDESKLPNLNGLFAQIYILLSGISLLLGLIISWKADLFFGSMITPEEYILLKELFTILSFTTCLTVINCIFSSLIIANEQFIFGKLVILIEIVLAPLITIPLLMNGYGSSSVFTVKLVLTILITVFNAGYCLYKLNTKFNFRNFDTVLIKSILVFAGAIVVQSVMDQLNWQVDKLVLAWTSGTTEISIYSVGSTLNHYYLTIAGAVSGVFIAEINRLVAYGKNKEISDLFVKTSRIFAFLVFLIMSGYCIFGRVFILRWAGEEYEVSYYVGLLLMLPVTASLSMGLGQDIMRAKNIHKMQIFINIAVTFCNFIVSIPLAMTFGAVGSALGTFLCEIIICIIVQSIYYNRVGKLDMRAYYREMLHILPGLILPVIYGVIVMRMKFVQISYLSLGFHILIYVCIYAISMWLFAMNSYEKNLAKKIIVRVISKFKG